MRRRYAGIGPRKTPHHIQDQESQIAAYLYSLGYCLSSGYAIGSDQAFGKTAVAQQIFLPWEGYNGGHSNGISKAVRPITTDQIEIAGLHYEQVNWDAIRLKNMPHWNQLKETTKLLLCRNVPIILGEYLTDPVDFVCTWIPEGYAGGTAHALSIAQAHKIIIFNLANPENIDRLIHFVEEKGLTYEQPNPSS